MAKRVNNEPLRAMAERMFVEEGMTAKSIALAIDVTEQTVGRWRKGIQGDISWDDKKTEFLSAPHNIKKVLMNELNHLSKGGDATIDVKAIKEVSNVISTLSDKVSTQITFSVFREFDNWMATQDPEKAIEFLDWHRTFLLHKAQAE
ncbi:hypothetical protein [Amniculibacterium sp. G2-70]|uniref:hypothetical protein n=1 Tax=Amniculibacterium sp. G2-70 TaxID=2767188 RepID=UPI0016547E6A|nr:hypothetical protein [Amniculibacterium sp. G2-70]